MASAVILVSGRGSNLRAIVEARTGLEVKAVISNRPDAGALSWSKERGIATRVVDHLECASREAFDDRLALEIDRERPDFILLAGFMRIFTPGFVERYARRMLNIHPSLLPAFPGLHTHRQALAAGVKLHGATVHFVTNALDSGPIVAQAAVPVLASDSEESLAERVLAVEHRLYPRVVRWLVEDRIEFPAPDVVQVRRSGVSTDWIAAPRNLE